MKPRWVWCALVKLNHALPQLGNLFFTKVASNLTPFSCYFRSNWKLETIFNTFQRQLTFFLRMTWTRFNETIVNLRIVFTNTFLQIGTECRAAASNYENWANWSSWGACMNFWRYPIKLFEFVFTQYLGPDGSASGQLNNFSWERCWKISQLSWRFIQNCYFMFVLWELRV